MGDLIKEQTENKINELLKEIGVKDKRISDLEAVIERLRESEVFKQTISKTFASEKL